jgi:hydrogenase maturation protease
MKDRKTIIAGIGNRLLGDDGFGPKVTDLLNKMPIPDHIEVRDMGTAGITIVTDLADYQRAIFLDTMTMEGEPGKLYLTKLQVDEPTEDIADLSRMSLQEVGLEGLLKFAKAINVLPEEIILIGCKPKTLEMGLELSDEVKAATHEAVEIVMNLIKGS